MLSGYLKIIKKRALKNVERSTASVLQDQYLLNSSDITRYNQGHMAVSAYLQVLVRNQSDIMKDRIAE